MAFPGDRARHALEELDRLESVISEALDRRPEHVVGVIRTDRVIARALKRHQELSGEVYDMLRDSDGLLAGEGAGVRTGEAALSAFDESVSRLTSYYDSHPEVQDAASSLHVVTKELSKGGEPQGAVATVAAAAGPEGSSLLDLLEEEELFSGPEQLGQCLDFEEHLKAYKNLPWKVFPWERGVDKDKDDDEEGEGGGGASASAAVVSSTTEAVKVLKSDKKEPPKLTLLDFCSVVKQIPTEVQLPNRLREKKYLSYLRNLAGYLCSFIRRAEPLVELNRGLARHFAKDMVGFVPSSVIAVAAAAGGLEEKESKEDGDIAESGKGEKEEGVVVEEIASIDALEEVGGEELKKELQRRGLKCGGTVRQRAERLWKVRGLTPDKYPKKLRAKHAPIMPTSSASASASASASSSSSASSSTTTTASTTLASSSSPLSPPTTASLVSVPFVELVPHGGELEGRWLECVVQVLLEHLSTPLESTEKYASQILVLTAAELAREEEDSLRRAQGALRKSKGTAAMEEAELRKKHGGKKHLVLDWEGKRIPYWLYKLHQMDIPYRCEICGGETYWGRLSYEQHFGKPLHTNNLKALGIPNTKHFFGVTGIEEAKRLWKRLEKDMSKSTWKAEEEEQYEDSQGNVLDRKTYEDLARQGLL